MVSMRIKLAVFLFFIKWEDRAWDDYLYWQTQDRKTLKRINTLITDICRRTFDGIGNPEPLRAASADGGAGGSAKPTGLSVTSRTGLSILSPAVGTMIKYSTEIYFI